MISKILKKFFSKSEEKESAGGKFALKLREKSAAFIDFFGKKAEFIKDEFFIIKSKCKNLRQTNYLLGLKHIENGHLTDAIFRFRFIKKFWPDLFDAYYQLAYCLALDNQPQKAREVLQELLAKNPNYDQKARDLLERIDKILQKAAPDA